ncbi:conserved exported hypothetical protein [Flavobacterium sp. 9AF]|uniref:SixA phosphatase family protein n=1 Tax=Flavobacterium sp. 9AF TaxID=2653142 RepID=UPI0012F175C0|nr:phosphoglycerate mutase family protein [Flavobacterium sp. 9AF]VXC00965.1 conserved exported hypothetical protein [Flavobacterium sp. 9AF]
MKKILGIFLFFLCYSFLFAQSNNTEPIMTKIILMRHAEKIIDNSKDPILSKEGENRAERLDFLFSEVSIDNVYSSDYIRTKGTVAKLASTKNLTIKIYNPKDTEFSKYLLEVEKGKTTVVVGHSNSIPLLVNKLIAKEQYKPLSEDVFSKIWILTFSDQKLLDCSVLNY